MSDKKEHRKHLYYLDELSDYKVDSDDPDVRGWPVKDAEGRVVGKVDNLLVSKEKERVLYLDVEVDTSIIDANHDPYGTPTSTEVHEFLNKDGENHLILPIGLAHLNVDDNFVHSDKINYQTFAETKRMAKGYDVDRDYEKVVLKSYNRNIESDRDRDLNPDSELDAERKRIREADRAHTKNHDASDDRTIGDRDRRATDRERDPLTGNESGTYSDHSDDDAFYDRGEFESERFRRNR